MKKHSWLRRSILCMVLFAVHVQSESVTTKTDSETKKPFFTRTRIVLAGAVGLVVVGLFRASGSTGSSGSTNVDVLPPFPPRSQGEPQARQHPRNSSSSASDGSVTLLGSSKYARQDLAGLRSPLCSAPRGVDLLSTMTQTVSTLEPSAEVSMSASPEHALDWFPELRKNMKWVSNYSPRDRDFSAQVLQGCFNDDARVVEIISRSSEKYIRPEYDSSGKAMLLPQSELRSFEENSGPLARDPKNNERTTYLDIFKIQLCRKGFPLTIINATLVVRSWYVRRGEDFMYPTYLYKPKLFLERSTSSAVS